MIFVGITLFYAAGFFYLLIWGDRAVFELNPPAYSEKECQFLKGRNGNRIAYRVATNPQAEYTLIYSHGSASDLGILESHVEAHCRFGLNGVVYDYPGVGHSDGPLSEQGCYDALADIYLYVREERRVPPEKILLYGRSIGTGPTLELAVRELVGGVILISPFTSALDVDFLTRIFPFEKFPNIKRIGSVKSPILILHGKLDKNIPWQNAVKLHQSAPAGTSLKLLEDCGHEDIHVVPGYWKALREFLNQVGKQ